MAEVTAKDVAALRKVTGAGMMDCKKALIECDGDLMKLTRAGALLSNEVFAAFV